MTTINLIIGIILIVTGVLVKKYPNLIAGYNTMSGEQKQLVHIDGLSSMMRTGLVAMGIVVVLSESLLSLFNLKGYGTLLMIPTVLFGTAYLILNAQKFQKGSSRFVFK